ncbi:MAG: hypothetical protein NUW37_08050 [Planctomycetes bacterium]|nr:hypothetical protein [Planctomycetota bacterium]
MSFNDFIYSLFMGGEKPPGTCGNADVSRIATTLINTAIFPSDITGNLKTNADIVTPFVATPALLFDPVTVIRGKIAQAEEAGSGKSDQEVKDRITTLETRIADLKAWLAIYQDSDGEPLTGTAAGELRESIRGIIAFWIANLQEQIRVLRRQGLAANDPQVQSVQQLIDSADELQEHLLSLVGNTDAQRALAEQIRSLETEKRALINYQNIDGLRSLLNLLELRQQQQQPRRPR